MFLSTNKVYGDAPNELPLVELETRRDYANPAHLEGVDETCRTDATMHSLFGAIEARSRHTGTGVRPLLRYADLCFRGGCLTGPNHSGVELHGFLAYLARALREGLCYRVFGYKGKQVRDNIHSYDVVHSHARFR